MQNHRSFHPYIADAYTAVHQWLATKPQVNGYQKFLVLYTFDLSN
jgi:hypothetical protein